MRKILEILLFITITNLFYSCTIQKSSISVPLCPTPKIECKTEKYKGIPRDTSIDVARLQGWHYRIEPVQMLNTSGDEWQVSFDNLTPYLTITDGNINRLMQGKMINFKKILPQKFVNPDEVNHLGFPAFSNKYRLLSVASNYLQNKQNEFKYVDGRILVPINEAIGVSRIYVFTISDKNISLNKELLSKTNILDWYSHPAIGWDGEVIFFASDRQGGYGGTDIWYVINKNDAISEPINCGENLNTACDEITPFVSFDGKYLYFSSNGGETVGGFDLFRCSIEYDSKNGKINIGKRENLRAPFNTQFNEIAPTCLVDCDSLLYYSSDQFRNSKSQDLGGYDIFVRYKEYIKQEVKKKELTEPALIVEKKETVEIETPRNWFYRLEGKVFEKNTQKPIQGAEVITRETMSNITNTVKTNQDGYYSIQMIKNEEYLVTAQYSTLFPENKKIFVGSNDTTSVLNQDFYLEDKYTLRINFPTDVFDNPYRFVLDSNGNETNVTWQEDLQALANNIITMKEKITKILLVGHTDDVGTIEYNQKLGERRVNFVINELVKRGVPTELLEGRSAGELEPLERKSDEKIENYRKRLRRVVLERVLK